jgi:hypothetical protein
VLTGIVFDALDVATMERFWTMATGGKTSGLRLRFEATDQQKTAKNRLHLCLAGGPGWAAEVERLRALGATPVDIGQGEVPWDVLADPEGNEFCVLRPGHPGVVVDGGLAAICLDMAAEDRQTQTAFWRTVTGWNHTEDHDWGVRLRRTSASPVSLTMGPPAAPKTGRNRLRLEVSDRDRESGEYRDPCGNEFHSSTETMRMT